MPTFADHLNACRKTTGGETDALHLAQTTWRDLPVKLATDRGHTVVYDGTSQDRWTCTDCGRAVLCVDANIYGSAITEDCNRKEN